MKRLATSTMQGACAVLFLCAASPAMAQGAGKRPRTSLGRELNDSIARVLHAAVLDRAFPGAYAIVGDSRGILAEQGAGRLDWTTSPRPDQHTLWDLASLTKVVGTTTALAQLVERGAVVLDSPVQRYVPDWTGPGKDAVTVRHLLTHTSGLPSFKPYDRLTHDPDSLTTLLFTTTLEQAPGARMTYSDIGAFMMGVVVERVSGKRLDRYLDEHLFRPLRMRETTFNPPRSAWKRVAPTEHDSLRGGLVRGKVHDERAYYLGGIAAHAGLFGSAHDLSLFATMLLRNGVLHGNRVLDSATIAQFTAYADSLVSNRALGWQKIERPEMPYKTSSAWAGKYMSSRAFGHTGFTGTSIAIDPELDLYVILLSNRVNPTRNNPKIVDVRARLADAIVAAVRHYRGQTLNAELP